MRLRESHVTLLSPFEEEHAGNAFIIQKGSQKTIYAISHDLYRRGTYQYDSYGRIMREFPIEPKENTKIVKFANGRMEIVVFKYEPDSDIAVSDPSENSKIYGNGIAISSSVDIGDQLTVIGYQDIWRRFHTDVIVKDVSEDTGLIRIETRKGNMLIAGMSGSALIRDPNGEYVGVAMLAFAEIENDWLSQMVTGGRVAYAEILPPIPTGF